MTSLVLCTGKWKVHFQDFHEKNLNRTFSIDCDFRILTFSIFDEKIHIFRKLFYFQLNILISGFGVISKIGYIDVGDRCWRRNVLMTATRGGLWFCHQHSVININKSLSSHKHHDVTNITVTDKMSLELSVLKVSFFS